MTDKPERIRLSRKKGWRMPANTVKVDRSTPWGNPFVTGKHGTRKQCVKNHIYILSGKILLGKNNFKEQENHIRHVKQHIESLKGKNLACWCPLNKPCHADTLLFIANAEQHPVKCTDEMMNDILKT